MSTRISLYLDTRSRLTRKSKKFPIKLRVYYAANRSPKLYPTIFELSQEDWGKLKAKRISDELREIRDKLEVIEGDAILASQKIKYFSLEVFYKIHIEKNSDYVQKGPKEIPKIKQSSPKKEGKYKNYGLSKYPKDRTEVDYNPLGPLAILFGTKIKQLSTNRKSLKTIESYFSSLISFLDYQPNLSADDITIEFLYGYEEWFLSKKFMHSKQKRSDTSVGIYMRNLRHIIKLEVDKGNLLVKNYPFGINKYVIPEGQNPKIATPVDIVKSLWDYLVDCHAPAEHYYLSMWFFGLMANGINPKDVANLRYKNREDDFFVIRREKTKRTRRKNPRPIVIPILGPMELIIQRYGNPDKSPDNFIFDILKPELSAQREREFISQFCNTLRDWMKRICTKLKLGVELGAKEYRHTFGTFLKYAGYSYEFIMEQYGHGHVSTTMRYLADFGSEVKKEANFKIFHSIMQFSN